MPPSKEVTALENFPIFTIVYQVPEKGIGGDIFKIRTTHRDCELVNTTGLKWNSHIKSHGANFALTKGD